jgi:hypothetical protein
VHKSRIFILDKQGIINVLLIIFIIFLFIYINNRYKSSEFSVVEKMQQKSLVDKEADLINIVKKYGPNVALDWTREGFVSETINMFECHTFTHIIGHNSLDYYNGDIEKALKDMPLNECEGGYAHGIEAQLVDDNRDYRQILFDVCEILRSDNFYGGCYHGAGHAFMSPRTTPEEALDYCNKLTGGPESNLDSCYNGVFSEYTNLIGGYDGHTGLPLANGPAFKFEGPAIKFCAGFEKKYQVSCALEVSGFGLGPGSDLVMRMDYYMKQCVDSTYNIDLQKACLQSMAAVSTQHGLPVHDINPPEFIHNLPRELKYAYIAGAASEMGQFIYNGQNKDWQNFCLTFPILDDKNHCESFFGDYL